MTEISQSVNEDLASGLRTLIEKILVSKQLSDSSKREMIEELETLSEQAKLPKKDRKTRVAKAIYNHVKSVLSVLSDFKTIWPVIQELIEVAFSIG